MATNPDSWLHVARRADDQPGANPRDIAEASANALARLINADAFEPTTEPTYFIYQYSEVGHRQIGLVANIPIEAFIDGRVMGHEQVEPQRVRALVAHQAKLTMRGDLVALLFPDDDDLVDVLTPVTDKVPNLDIPGELHHRIWKVPAGLNVAISSRFEGSILYLLDGHHRVAAALEEWENLGNPAGFSLLCLLTPKSQLRSLSFDRRVVGPIVRNNCMLELAAAKTTEPFRRRGEVCVYFEEHWWQIPLVPGQSGVAALDVMRLHDQILRPVFGINDFTSPLLEVTSEKVDLEVLRYRCDNDGGAAFIIAAPTVDEILHVANGGEQLPPKSSYFDPKPWSGVFLSAPLEPRPLPSP